MSAIVDFLRSTVLDMRSGLEATSADAVSAESWYVPYIVILVCRSFPFALILVDCRGTR